MKRFPGPSAGGRLDPMLPFFVVPLETTHPITNKR